MNLYVNQIMIGRLKRCTRPDNRSGRPSTLEAFREVHFEDDSIIIAKHENSSHRNRIGDEYAESEN